jgi:hypothetical protein
MKPIASRVLAALILGLVWLSAAPAKSDCELVFEVIPSTDAGAIVGALVEHNLAGKSFEKWSRFTAQQARPIVQFLRTNFVDGVEFDDPAPAMGGYQGKSSPNLFIPITLEVPLEGDALGRVISPITAAVGFVLIQDGTVAYCEDPVGRYGGAYPLYGVEPDKGFRPLADERAEMRFVRTVYSAMVAANDDLDIGYTFYGPEKPMLLLDFGALKNQLDATNAYFLQLYASPVSIKYYIAVAQQPTIYEANDWASDPEGLALLAKLPEEVLGALPAARAAYLLALKKFAATKD